jgi:hypothetical protein
MGENAEVKLIEWSEDRRGGVVDELARLFDFPENSAEYSYFLLCRDNESAIEFMEWLHDHKWSFNIRYRQSTPWKVWEVISFNPREVEQRDANIGTAVMPELKDALLIAILRSFRTAHVKIPDHYAKEYRTKRLEQLKRNLEMFKE